MSRACGFCSHPNRTELERRVLAGEPIRVVAIDLGHSESAVYRHVRQHLRRELRDQMRVSTEAHLADFTDRLRELVTETAAVREQARRLGDGRLLLQAVAGERDTLAVLMERLGVDSDETVDLLREGQVLVAALGAVMPLHPEASKALAQHLTNQRQPELAAAFRKLAERAPPHPSSWRNSERRT